MRLRNYRSSQRQIVAKVPHQHQQSQPHHHHHPHHITTTSTQPASDDDSALQSQSSATELVISKLKGQLISARLEQVSLERERDGALQTAKYWQQAMQQDSRPGSKYRYQLSQLKREVNESKMIVQERDNAIEKLVQHSAEQETRLKKELKESMDEKEKEWKAKWAKQEEQMEIWKRAVKSNKKTNKTTSSPFDPYNNSAVKQSSSSDSHQEQQQLKEKLRQTEGQCFQYRKETITLRKQLLELQTQRYAERASIEVTISDNKLSSSSSNNNSSSKPSDLELELQELKAENESSNQALRELRRQLWSAREKAAVGSSSSSPRDVTNIDSDSLAIRERQLEQTKEQLFQEYEEGPKLEIQDLKQQLQAAQEEAAAEAKDLRMQLDQTKETLNAYARKLEQAEDPNKLVPLRVLLDKTIQKNSSLESERTELLGTVRRLGEELLAQEKRAALGKEEFIEKVERCEEIIQEQRDEMERLNGERKHLEDELEEAQAAADQLRIEVFSRTQNEVEIKQARDKLLSETESQKARISDLKVQLEVESSGKGKQSVELRLVQTYKRQIWALTRERDELEEELKKERQQEEPTEQSRESKYANVVHQCQELKREIDAIRENSETIVRRKDEHIDALETALCAQQEILGAMKDEFDNMQQDELTELQSKVKKQEETILLLERKLDDCTLEYTATDFLKQKLADLESQLNRHDDNVCELNAQLEERDEEILRMKGVIQKMEIELQQALEENRPHGDDNELWQRFNSMKTRYAALQKKNRLLVSQLEKSPCGFSVSKLDELEELETECSTLKAEVDKIRKVERTDDATEEDSKSTAKGGAESSQVQASKRLRKFASFFKKKRDPKLPTVMEILEEAE